MTLTNRPISITIQYVSTLHDSCRNVINRSEPRHVHPVHVVIVINILLNIARRLHVPCRTCMLIKQRHISPCQPLWIRYLSSFCWDIGRITERFVIKVVSWSLVTINLTIITLGTHLSDFIPLASSPVERPRTVVISFVDRETVSSQPTTAFKISTTFFAGNVLSISQWLTNAKTPSGRL